YARWPTPLGRGAAAHGARGVARLERLGHPAARQFRPCTGAPAPAAEPQAAGRPARGHTHDARRARAAGRRGSRPGALAGGRPGGTLGSPLAVMIGNTEWPKWETVMSADPVESSALAASDDVGAEKELARNRPLTRRRPGHADLVGMQKYGFDEARPVLERASARETAARVALGAVATKLLRQATEATVVSHVIEFGTVRAPAGTLPTIDDVERLDTD